MPHRIMTLSLTASEGVVVLRALALFHRCHTGDLPCTASALAERLRSVLEQPAPVEEVVAGMGMVGSGV